MKKSKRKLHLLPGEPEKGESDEALGLVESKKEEIGTNETVYGNENRKGQHSGVVDNEANNQTK
jgi:hypothetical protein